jgi:putative drug/metabolite transporter DUF486
LRRRCGRRWLSLIRGCAKLNVPSRQCDTEISWQTASPANPVLTTTAEHAPKFHLAEGCACYPAPRSKLFMTAAWYWHLRVKEAPLFAVIRASWAVAFVEYCLAVPANRWGSAVYSAAQDDASSDHAPGHRRVLRCLSQTSDHVGSRGGVALIATARSPYFAARCEASRTPC